MTEKLYLQDPYIRKFHAVITECTQHQDGYHILLDRTAFYPEGGGQPADHGIVGGVAVHDVHEKGGLIYHYTDAPLSVGDTVEAEIDWERRFDHMQQHSGEHIVSGLICKRFSCDNVGFHMGADIVTIDFNADIDWETLLEIEQEANRYICESHSVEIASYEGAALQAIDYRSKKEIAGEVRIVRFPNADCCACCGTHLAKSSEVGLVKFISCQKFREGVRITLLCGHRARRYLSEVWSQNLHISQALSAKPMETASAVQRMMESLECEKSRSNSLENELFSMIAVQLDGKGNALLVRDTMPPDSVRRLCDLAGQRCRGICVVVAGEGSAWKYAICGKNSSVQNFVKDANAALHGRGGGKDGFAQGSFAASIEEIKHYFCEEHSFGIVD